MRRTWCWKCLFLHKKLVKNFLFFIRCFSKNYAFPVIYNGYVHHTYFKDHLLSGKLTAMETEAKQKTLQRLQEIGSAYAVDSDSLFLQEGQLAGEIHKLAKEHAVDLIVVGTHGKLSDSTANAVLHGADCDTLSVRIQPWY